MQRLRSFAGNQRIGFWCSGFLSHCWQGLRFGQFFSWCKRSAIGSASAMGFDRKNSSDREDRVILL